MQGCTSSCWSILSFQSCNVLMTPSATLYFSRIMPQYILHQFVTEWFEQQNIQVGKHPPYSPDLNPIEHVWVVLKKQLHKLYPDIADTPGGPDAVRARLVEVLPKVWDSLPEQFNNLYRSMPDRVAAVIDVKEWYTRY